MSGSLAAPSGGRRLILLAAGLLAVGCWLLAVGLSPGLQPAARLVRRQWAATLAQREPVADCFCTMGHWQCRCGTHPSSRSRAARQPKATPLQLPDCGTPHDQPPRTALPRSPRRSADRTRPRALLPSGWGASPRGLSESAECASDYQKYQKDGASIQALLTRRAGSCACFSPLPRARAFDTHPLDS
jgi:hypothetical protein